MSTTNRPKRSLFNKPSWAAKPTVEVSDIAVPIFGQNIVYEDIVAAEKKRREKHAQRAKERAEKEKEKAGKLKRQTVKVGYAKRRRISNEDLDEAHGSGNESGHESDARSTRSAKSISDDSNRSRSQSRTSSPPKERPILRSSLQKDKEGGLVSGLESLKSSRAKSQTWSTTIILDDEEGESRQHDSGAEDSNHRKSHRKPVVKSTEPESESEEEDEYLRELKQKAREEARMHRLRSVAGKEGTPDTNSRVISQDPRSPSQAREDSFNPQSDSRQASAAPDIEDPKVEILIKTMIPNAREMIVTRHTSQPLDKVKEFWCQRNNLNPAIVSKVFFTWNGTRLFNSTTMRSIITRLKKLYPMPDGSDPSMGKIEIEAVTEEIFEYRNKQRERRKREMAGLSESQEQTDNNENDNETQDKSNSNSNGPEQEQEQPPEKTGIIIKLTNPAQDDMSLRLRPNTTIAKILYGYRKIKKINPSKECWLVFDGERLEDTQTVEEVEFEHEDTVEVHIK